MTIEARLHSSIKHKQTLKHVLQINGVSAGPKAVAINASMMAVGTAHIATMNIISSLVAFIFVVGIARLLTPGDVGLISLMLSTVGIFNTITLLALNSAVIKYVSEFLGRGDKATASAAASRAFSAMTLISAPAFAAAALVSPLILNWAFHGQLTMAVLLLLLAVGLIGNYTNYYGAVMTGLAMFGTVAIQNIIFFVGSRIPSLAFASAGFGVNSVAFGFFLGSAVTLAFSIVAVRGRLVKSRPSFSLRGLLSFSLPLYATNIIGLAQGWADILLLYGLTSALATTGIYYIAIASAGQVSILWAPIVFTLLPALSSRYGANGVDGVYYAMTRALKLMTPLIVLASAGLVAISPTALSVVYGRDYVEGAVPFAIVTSLSLLSAFYAVFITTLQAIRRTGYIALAGALALAVNITVILLLVSRYGALGAMLGRASMAIVSFTVAYLALRKFKIPWNTMNIKRNALAATAVGVPLFLLDSQLRTIGLTPLITVLLDLTLFLPTTFITLKFLKLFDKEDLGMLKSVVPDKLKGLISLLG